MWSRLFFYVGKKNLNNGIKLIYRTCTVQVGLLRYTVVTVRYGTVWAFFYRTVPYRTLQKYGNYGIKKMAKICKKLAKNCRKMAEKCDFYRNYGNYGTEYVIFTVITVIPSISHTVT